MRISRIPLIHHAPRATSTPPNPGAEPGPSGPAGAGGPQDPSRGALPERDPADTAGAKPLLGRVLVVDDEVGIRTMVRTFLSRQGYEVATASNGAEALEQLRNGDPPAVIIVDLRMPVMDGFQLLAELRKDARLSRVPVVILSADPNQDGLEGLPTLAKPANFRQLLAAIRRAQTRPGA